MSIRIKRFGLALAMFVLAATAFGQSDRGTITGAVTDQSGAVIPSVPVIATNIATGVTFNTQTTETGNFTIPSVPVGSYSLRVENAGFRTFQQNTSGKTRRRRATDCEAGGSCSTSSVQTRRGAASCR